MNSYITRTSRDMGSPRHMINVAFVRFFAWISITMCFVLSCAELDWCCCSNVEGLLGHCGISLSKSRCGSLMAHLNVKSSWRSKQIACLQYLDTGDAHFNFGLVVTPSASMKREVTWSALLPSFSMVTSRPRRTRNFLPAKSSTIFLTHGLRMKISSLLMSSLPLHGPK